MATWDIGNKLVNTTLTLITPYYVVCADMLLNSCLFTHPSVTEQHYH